MIVAVSKADVGEVLVIGLSRKDIIELKRGLTKCLSL